MKQILLSTLIATALAVPVAYGVDEHHPDKAASSAKASPSTKAPRSAPKPPIDEKSMAQMQDHMKKMQDIMARLQKTNDPAERQKLMAEHTKAMYEGMQAMRGMGGGMMQGMMGAGMMGGAQKDGAGKPGMGRDAPMPLEMMGRRVDMMQMMMEQMMEHQKAQESAPK
jgi:hypothetical protein